MNALDELEPIIDEIIAPDAAKLDLDGTFPQRGIDALAAAGLLALTVPVEFGGSGGGAADVARLVRRIAGVCGSTAMVVTMHYAATALLIHVGHEQALREIGKGEHLTTLAFSESGSRSHFWAPVSTATPAADQPDGDAIVLNARKSWVTSAGYATSYVWSSRPLAADGPMSLWLVRRDTPGLAVAGGFDGLGLRGNDSRPVTAEDVRIPRHELLGADGAGLDLALQAALPWFLILNASAGLGLMEALTTATTTHLTGTRLQHLDQSLAQQLPSRARLARMQIETDRTRALLETAIGALDGGRPEAVLLVLEAKAATDEAAAATADLAMTACGGAAFRKELAIERRFRDSRAARVMAPTTDALHDFIGRALTGLPLLGGPA
ncbi:acyl-CoA dehydrogenase [Amycolatopsis acidicola]|uniref:Acyl-CoA dehydrogenase n=1 Tax=Amycolatopsis acidicola TaxID=2596893 RepID=A0A5N0VC87_9PSEU|nr:acyl-CoA dehydrogenase family protein [Amycolatopsis acidicola]KAA9163989.1 acyl-CoA dehydrogenase [Amycolatopsis acidicola]